MSACETKTVISEVVSCYRNAGGKAPVCLGHNITTGVPMSRPPFTISHRWVKVGQVAHVQIDRCECGMERRHVGSGYVFNLNGKKCKAGECGRVKELGKESV